MTLTTHGHNQFPAGDGRRFPNRAAAYPHPHPHPYIDRRAGAALSGFPGPSREPMLSDDEFANQRKRISVACGRCRKRKIRCSGDTGNGTPCTNCRNAGWEVCQYLRVASQEAQIKNDSFPYNMEASRQYQAGGGSSVPPMQGPVVQYEATGIQTPVDHEALAFRPAPSANFAYNARSFDAAAAHWTVEHGAVPFNVFPPTYASGSQQDQDLALGYRMASSTTSPVGSGNNIASSANNNIVSSNNVVASNAPEAAGLHFQTVHGASAAPAAEVHHRALPTRTRRIAIPASGVSPYRNGSCSPVCGKSSQSSSSGASPMTPGSESSAPSYTNYDSPSSAMPAVAASYSAMTIAAQLTRPTDMYSATGTSEAAMYSPGSGSGAAPMRQHGGSPDMTYRYTDTTAGTASPVTGTLLPKRERNPSSDAALALSSLHGPSYVAQNHGQAASYMLPGDVQGSTGPDADADDGEHKTAVLRT